MVIDTSALVAIFLGEPERQQFLEAITQSGRHGLSIRPRVRNGLRMAIKRGCSDR